jgi:cobalt-zinc-cadmium efflux system membrane fusion protein
MKCRLSYSAIRAAMFLLASTILLSSCSGPVHEQNNEKAIDKTAPIALSDAQAKELGLTTAVVQNKTLPVELDLAAVVHANENLSTPVNCLVPGRVEDVNVNMGDVVSRGQILAHIRCDEVGQIESEYLSKDLDSLADYKQKQVQQSLAEKVHQRKKTLYEEKIGAKADLEIAESELEQARAALTAITDKRVAAKSAIRQRLKIFGIPGSEVDRLLRTRQVQHVFEVFAPRTGIIIDRDANPGEIIDADKQLFMVADLSNVWLIAQVYEKDVPKMRLGLPVTVTLDSLPNEPFKGVLDFVGAQVNRETRTLSVRASINNPQLKLKPDMFARLKVKVATADAMIVPQEAVQKIGESSVVYVVSTHNNFLERKVKTGRILGDYVEILDGLRPRETVVVHGSLQLLGDAIQRLSQ